MLNNSRLLEKVSWCIDLNVSEPTRVADLFHYILIRIQHFQKVVDPAPEAERIVLNVYISFKFLYRFKKN
jgi:hypothetical protein